MKVVLLCILMATTGLAQTGAIADRVRAALATSHMSDTGADALQKGHFAELDELLNVAAAQDARERPELIALQGATAFLAGNMVACVSYFSQATRLRPLSDADTFTEAMAYARMGDDNQARPLIDELSRKHPDRALYLYWLGRLDYDQRRYSEAVAKLTVAAKLNPDSPRIWDSLGLAYDMQGQRDAAHGALEKAVALNRAEPRPSAWPPNDLGSLLLRMDEPQQAEKSLREALLYDPDFAQAHYYLGRVLEKERRDEDAIQQYLAAVSQDKSSAEPCYSLAMLYRKVHREQDAEAMFSEYKARKRAQPAPDLNAEQRPIQ
jgi:tetratricopeptide (TPR) repeat protein